MEGMWNLGANSLVEDPLPAGDLALQLGGRGDGEHRSTGRPDDGDRGRTGTRGGRDEEEEHEPGGPQEEVFMVAEWERKGGVARPPH